MLNTYALCYQRSNKNTPTGHRHGPTELPILLAGSSHHSLQTALPAQLAKK
jgi:hypothetical protein